MLVISKVPILFGIILLVLLIFPTVSANNQTDQYYNEGKNIAKLGQYTDAVTSYDKAIAINPDYAEAWFNRGVTLTYLGRHSEAVTSYDKAIAIKPDYAEAKQEREIALKKQTKTIPLLYAPIGAIVLMVGISVWYRHRDPPLK
jgi:tetratricopeptide (TPR) repeat protein